jgi:hypothetical protein
VILARRIDRAPVALLGLRFVFFGRFGRYCAKRGAKEGSMTPDIGDMTLDFELVDSSGVVRSLDALTASQPRVLIFYRGHW